ncbi:hypothetical protein ACWEQ3_01460 [Streptomyces mirabilis]
MGDHSTPKPGVMSSVRASANYGALLKVKLVLAYLVTHRRKIVSALVVALPIVARLIPDFPADDILDVLRTYFGA